MNLQHTMRSLIRGIPRIALGGVPAERAGDERLAFRKLKLSPTGVRLSSRFADGEPIPFEHSADGGGIAPPLDWRGVPEQGRSLALLVEDPDAPTPNPFVHWIVHGIGPHVLSIGAALTSGAHVGRNSMMKPGWAGCAPPRGDTRHRYFFQLYALDRELPLKGHVGRSAFLDALHGHVLGLGLLVGTYRR